MKLKKLEIKDSDKVLLICIIIIIVAFIFIKLFTYRSEPILMDYAKKESNIIISSIINKSINEIVYKDNYYNYIKIEKDSSGEITNLNFNNNKINQMLYLITDSILNSIKKIEKGDYNNLNVEHINNKDNIYYIPMGIIHNIPILVNIGPKIPFKIEMLGSTNNSSYNNIKEYGINSSIVEVFIKIEMQIQIILPFKSDTVTVEKNVLLDSKIVQGKIPDYYGGMLSTSLK